MSGTLLLAGCGSMGSALLHGWQSQSFPFERVDIIDPSPKHIAETAQIHLHASLDALPAEVSPSLILFAVKPQTLPELAPAYAARFGDNPLLLSIAAGKTIPFFTAHFGENARIIRIMPNTPSLIGEGAGAFVASARCTAQERALAAQLLSAAGKFYELTDETLLDAVTALSGSGPAYVFYFMECLARAGVIAGLPPQIAEALAAQTVRGSALLHGASNTTFAALRKQVTSPGGTTEAAMSVLTSAPGLNQLMGDAVEAALQRAKELAE